MRRSCGLTARRSISSTETSEFLASEMRFSTSPTRSAPSGRPSAFTTSPSADSWSSRS